MLKPILQQLGKQQVDALLETLAKGQHDWAPWQAERYIRHTIQTLRRSMTGQESFSNLEMALFGRDCANCARRIRVFFSLLYATSLHMAFLR